jgi:putative membrane protein
MFAKLTLIAALALPTASYAEPAAAPTDPQIAHIAYSAGLIDIASARQALAKSKNPAVRSFAEEMVRDHTAVNDKVLALVKKLHMPPQDSPTSQLLKTQADAKHAELAKLSGAAFDKAYAASEVAYHQAVNSALRTTLIPDAHDAELKSLLETGLKLFTNHQHRAEQLAGSLK